MILVTGAAGNVGRNIVEQLSSRELAIRALVRQPPDRPFPIGVEVAKGDLADSRTLVDVLRGVSTMFLFPAMKLAADLAELAQKCGVRRVVALSSSVVQREESSDTPIAKKHRAAEVFAQTSPFDWTILRPDTFAANALAWAEQIRMHSLVRAPYPRSHRNAIHERDIAGVAVAALVEDGHEGSIYPLTGPQSLTQLDQVRAIGAAIGRTIAFEELSHEAAKRSMLGRMPEMAADQLLAYLAKCVDVPARVLDTVERVTGSPARPFTQWAGDHAADFR